jgi:hypothetical protein
MADPMQQLRDYAAKLDREAKAMKSQSDWVRRYFFHLGIATSAWAALELVLELNVHVVSAYYADGTITKNIPKQLGQKLKYLKNTFTKLDALSAERDQALSDVAKLELLGEERHRLIHGSGLAYFGTEVRSSNMNFTNPTEYRVENYTVTVEHLNKFIQEVGTLLDSQIGLGLRISAPFPGGT